jgi:hypothetical protein
VVFTIPTGRGRCGRGGGQGLEGAPGLPDRLVEKRARQDQRHAHLRISISEIRCRITRSVRIFRSARTAIFLRFLLWNYGQSDKGTANCRS